MKIRLLLLTLFISMTAFSDDIKFDNVAKSIEKYFCTQDEVTKKFDCSSLTHSSKSLEFCDESLAKLPQLKEYLDYYKKALPVKTCVNLTVKLNNKQQFETTWKLSANNTGAETPVAAYISIEECKKKVSTFPLYNCSYTPILLENFLDSETHILDKSSSFIILNKDRPLSLDGGKKTYRTRFVNGKNRRFEYFLKPINVPSSRKTLITQCYQSSFSHAQFELDFNLINREEVRSTDMGVVTMNYQGSPLRCNSYIGSSGELRFNIYWGGIYVDQNLSKCKTGDCSVTVMPWYCLGHHSANRLMIKHPDHTFTQYVHLTRTNTTTRFGDVIPTKGVPIARIGESGWITGAHLHFEVMDLVKNSNGFYDFFNIPTYFNTKNYGITWPCAKGGKLLEPL